MIDGIDILRGGSPLLGAGGSIGGAVNFKLRPPDDSLHISLLSRGNTLHNYGLSFIYNQPVFNVKQQLRVGRHFGANRYSANGVTLQNRDFKRLHLQWQTRIRLTGNQQLETLAYHFRSEAGAAKPFINAGTETANKARISVNNTLTRLRWRMSLSAGSIQSQLYVRNEWLTYYDPSVYINAEALKSVHFNNEVGWISRWRYMPDSNWLIITGADGRRQMIRSSEAGVHTRYNGAVYASLNRQWARLENQAVWHLLLSLRGELADAHQKALWLPALSLRRETGSGSVYLSYMQNFRAPSFNALYWQPGGNPDLNPENAYGWEGGLDYLLGGDNLSLRQALALYQNDVQNQIVWLPDENGAWRPQNFRRVRARGMEWESRLISALFPMELLTRLTYNHTVKSAPDNAQDKTAGNVLPYHPQWTFYGNIIFTPGQWRVSLDYIFNAFAYTTIANDNNNFIPSFHIINGSISRTLYYQRRQFILAIQINNAFNTPYQTQKGYPMPGRYAGLAIAMNFN